MTRPSCLSGNSVLRTCVAVLVSSVVSACSSQPPPDQHAASSSATSANRSKVSGSVQASLPPTGSASAPPVLPPSVATARAEKLLFPGGLPATVACDKAVPATYVRCLVTLAFDGHAAETSDAVALFDELGDVVGLEGAHEMDGGFRGNIRIVPELPVGPHKRHLAWILQAQRDIAAFVTSLEQKASAPLRYRHRALGWRFMRSVGRTTPSAYAASWEVGYNVSGSLHGSVDAVRETIFHEVFHLNDQEHDNWSRRALGSIVDGIAKKCGTKTPCLAPYAPGKTMVRGGTYYAFTPDNGDLAHEYSAELATRYFQEQRAAAGGQRQPGGWFKCGPPENAQAMTALASEFFAGVDLTPACP